MGEAQKLPVVVLLSGGGSNLQAIIDQASTDLPVEIRAVISNRAGVQGLERAKNAGIEALALEHTAYASREEYDNALAEQIEAYAPGLVLLAGFMRILTPEFVARFHGRLLNIHPSLLPNYRGLHTHQRALEAGDRKHGASVHFVTEELDGGPVILQAEVPVEDGDDAGRLAARVLTQEHIIYPLVVRWFAEGRLRMLNHSVEKDGQTLNKPLTMRYGEAPPR